MHRRALLLVFTLAALVAGPAHVRAQQDCDFTGTQSIRGAGSVIYLTVARLTCTDMRIRADSATLYQDSRTYYLFGRVVIDNPEVHLQAREAQYYPDQGLIQAQGSVSLLRKADSTSITGGEQLVLYRAGVLGRTEDALTVEGGRPHAVMHPKRADDADPDSAAAEPYEIDAQRIEVRGQNELKAQGSVQMRRGDLNASADTLSYLNETGQLLLSGSASLDVETYLLTGGLIVVTMAEDEIQDILARRNAHLTGDLDIEGGFIQLELSDGQLEGVTAGPDPEAGAAARPADVTPQPQGGRGAPTSGGASASNAPSPRQATASSEELTITADRLDIDVTAGALQRLDARGRARLVTRGADSLNTAETPEVARSDWIEGDTINALFTPPDSAGADTVASAMADSVFTDMEVDPDSAKHPRLELLIARVNARALYRLPPADTASGGNPACTGPGRFAVHYVVGDSITITMQDDEVDEMNVVGQVVGQHLEPPACAPASPADTTAAPVPAPADTTAPARPPAGGTPRPEPAVGSPHRPSDAQGETPALPGRPTGSIRRPGRIRPRARREPERTR